MVLPYHNTDHFCKGSSHRQGLWRLPVKLLLPTKNELGGGLDPDEKDVFGVNAKALPQTPHRMGSNHSGLRQAQALSDQETLLFKSQSL